MPGVIDLDDYISDANTFIRPDKSNKSPRIEIRKSEWGYWTKIEFPRGSNIAFWSKTFKRAHKRAQKKVDRFERLKKWADNPLVLYPDPDTNALIPAAPKNMLEKGSG
jgi:hypothetical protein